MIRMYRIIWSQLKYSVRDADNSVCGKGFHCNFISQGPLMANLYVQTAFNNILEGETGSYDSCVEIGNNSM